MPSPFADDPRLAAMLSATRELTGPGQPFEMVEEMVLGEQILVFKDRARSMRQVLVEGTRFGDRDAYVFDDGTRITFTSLPRQAAAVAAHMRDKYQIGPGDVVGICAANCPQWLQVFWGATSMNAVVAGMNGWWTATEMRTAIELAEPSLLFMDEKRAARLDSDPGVPLVIVDRDFAPFLEAEDAALASSVIAEDDPAMLIFTSGTTGRPKAATHSHRTMVSNLSLQGFLAARSSLVAGHPIPTGPGPTRLSPFPLFHVAGMGLAVGTLMNGTKSVWPLGRFEPAKVVDLTIRENIAIWAGGMTHVARLLDSPELDRLPPKQLVSVGVGGSPTTPGIMRKVEDRFPHLKGTMSTGYGSTETGGVVSQAPNWMLRAIPECVGPALPTIQMRITDESGQEVADWVEGNVEVRSPYTMLCYWHNDQANAEIFRPGRWLLTGDFGWRDDGLFYIASRRRDLILRGGENIYPFEIENRLEEHPDVAEAAVFGVDDPVHGQVVKAVLVVPEGTVLSDDKVRAFCAETLAYYKVPEYIELRHEPLPRNPTGKVMKHVLSGAGASGFVGEDD